MSTNSRRLQPLNASTNLLRVPTLTESQHPLGGSTNFQSLQAPTCRLRHKVSPNTSLPPLFASSLQKKRNVTIQMCLYLPNHSALFNCSTSSLCSSVLFNCSTSTLCSYVLFNCLAHSSVPMLFAHSRLFSLLLFICSASLSSVAHS